MCVCVCVCMCVCIYIYIYNRRQGELVVRTQALVDEDVLFRV